MIRNTIIESDTFQDGKVPAKLGIEVLLLTQVIPNGINEMT